MKNRITKQIESLQRAVDSEEDDVGKLVDLVCKNTEELCGRLRLLRRRLFWNFVMGAVCGVAGYIIAQRTWGIFQNL